MNAAKTGELLHATSGLSCWSCGAAVNGSPFCAACGKIQPQPPGADHFSFFGLPRKLRLSLDVLEQKFLKLSWKLHPDNFVNAIEHERELSLQRSSQLNDAHRVLRDPVARVEYLLELAGMRKEGQQKQQAPPELLEEVFELNESLDELRDAKAAGSDLQALTSRLKLAQNNFHSKLAEVDGQMQTAAEQWDAALDAGATDAGQKAILLRLNELLNRRSYIRNLVAGVEKELSAD